MLDDLVATIETLKTRIRDHGDSLRQNEYRTRTALIDPLLKVLGWDVSDPSLVTPEYKVGSAGNSPRADYGLLDNNGNLVSAIEAKHLGESLANHEKQIFDYAWNLQIKFAGLTDGDHWYFVDLSQIASSDKTILQLRLTDTPTHEAALKLLLLWQPNLASGQPVAANAPVMTAPAQPALVRTLSQSTGVSPAQPPDLPAPTLVESNWNPLSSIIYQTGDKKPVGIRFSNGEVKNIKSWADMWFETCEWLAVSGKLTDPVPSPKGRSARMIVNTDPKHPPSRKHPQGNNFLNSRKLSTGLFIEMNYNPKNLLDNTKYLLERQGVSPDTVELRFE